LRIVILRVVYESCEIRNMKRNDHFVSKIYTSHRFHITNTDEEETDYRRIIQNL